MTILLFLFGVAVAAGLFFILADILKLPRLSTEKALLSAGRTEKKRMKSLDALFLGWAIKISKFTPDRHRRCLPPLSPLLWGTVLGTCLFDKSTR